MDDRVDNFLKVARDKIMEMPEGGDTWELSNLYEQLLKILDGNTDLARKLAEGWNAILQEKRILVWDERFLRVIAGETSETSTEEKLEDFTRQVTQGRSTGRTLYPSISAPSWTSSGTSTSLSIGNATVTEQDLMALKKLANENKI